MADFVLRFTIPQQRQGEREPYKAFTSSLRKLNQLMGKPPQANCSVDSVEVTGGSVRGRVYITAPSYQEALAFASRSAPIIDLEWHLEEKLEPQALQRILDEAIK